MELLLTSTVERRKMARPKTIVDLVDSSGSGEGPIESKPVVGKDLFKERDSLRERIRRLEERRNVENEILEAGGYDYDGQEAWAQVMSRVGRR